jgi:hypothetical protein
LKEKDFNDLKMKRESKRQNLFRVTMNLEELIDKDRHSICQSFDSIECLYLYKILKFDSCFLEFRSRNLLNFESFFFEIMLIQC